MDTTLGAWPGHSSSSAEPRQALGTCVWEWGGSLRAGIWEFLPSVQPTQDSLTPQRSCCALKATHYVLFPLRLLGLTGWGLGPSQLGVGESDPPTAKALVGPVWVQ